MACRRNAPTAIRPFAPPSVTIEYVSWENGVKLSARLRLLGFRTSKRPKRKGFDLPKHRQYIIKAFPFFRDFNFSLALNKGEHSQAAAPSADASEEWELWE